MNSLISSLVARLASAHLQGSDVIPWSCPVPSFGDLSRSQVATLGLNPSNREFVDEGGRELDGAARRFHTLRSLGLSRWADAGSEQFKLIEDSCRQYFSANPYDGWFRRLDRIINGRASYYGGRPLACHLDLIPYATATKWALLTHRGREKLLHGAGDTLGHLLESSPVRVLVLNGRSVVEHFKEMSGSQLRSRPMKDWRLPRQEGDGVAGFSYRATIRSFAGINLGRDLLVLGYNHNIQSSFGVTSSVIDSIRDWVTKATKAILA
ncbi:MAG: hypothetical protein IPI49_23810 [Myxococcales bacterium]|nr:hypothetical protein [Myxococcales bacterium]